VKILLDENFPLPLYHQLRAAGHDVEHIIALGQRGLPDAAIRQRLQNEDILANSSPLASTMTARDATWRHTDFAWARSALNTSQARARAD